MATATSAFTTSFTAVLAIMNASRWDQLALNWSASKNQTALPTQCAKTAESEPELLLLVRFIINEVCIPILVPFGVLANLLNVIVLTRKWMRSSTNCYLTTLAIYDSLYLLFAFFMAFSAYPSIRYEKWYVELRQFVQPMTNVFSNTAVWIVVSFSCERYIAISYPIKGRRWCTIKKAKRIIVAICVICFVITAPEFFCMKMAQNRCGNKTDYRVVPNKFHGVLDDYGYYYFNSTAFAYVPLFLLTVCNVLLIRAILRSRQLRKAMTLVNRDTNNVQTTRNGHSGHSHSHSHNRCGSLGTVECEIQNLTPAESNGASESNERARNDSKRRKSAILSATQKKDRGISEQNRLTFMLVIVVVAFLCCHLPAAIGTTIQSYLRYNRSLQLILKDGLKIYGNICNLLVQLNTASNFILYSMLSTKFRLTFRKIFCKCILPDDAKSLDGRYASMYTNKTACEMQSSCNMANEKRHTTRIASTNDAVSE